MTIHFGCIFISSIQIIIGVDLLMKVLFGLRFIVFLNFSLLQWLCYLNLSQAVRLCYLSLYFVSTRRYKYKTKTFDLISFEKSFRLSTSDKSIKLMELFLDFSNFGKNIKNCFFQFQFRNSFLLREASFNFSISVKIGFKNKSFAITFYFYFV